MRLFILLLFVSLNVMAVEWNDLEVSSEYKINQSFPLRQLGPNSSYLDIMEGEKFKLNDIIGLDSINVVLFELEYKNCPGQAIKTDMEIIAVKNTSPVVEVGAQVEENCKFQVFIENKDLMSESFFE